MLKAATSTITDRMMNIMLRSTSSTVKKLSFLCRQSEKCSDGSLTWRMAGTCSATVSGSVTSTSSTSTVSPLLKKRWACGSGMKIMLRSYSDMPISNTASTL